jgi:Domain of unknown function (DUF4349)
MSQPDHGAIVNEIRSARIVTSPELRARVLDLGAAVPPAPPRRGLPWRRMSLVLVPAAVALALAGALIAGLAGSGKKNRSGAPPERATGTALSGVAHGGVGTPTVQAERQQDTAKALGGAGGVGSIPATAGRAQRYESELTLKVHDLSTTTKRALRLTRSYHGYVRSVEYGSGKERGSAYLILRVPVGIVQEAIVKFSALGEILDQHVSIQDVQPTIDRRFRRMQAIRDQIAKLQAKLENPALTPDERTALENQLVARRRRLVLLQRQQAALQRQTSFATVSLSLRSADKATVVPHEPGRIERALDRSGSILLDELKVVVYVLIVGAPLLALAFLLFGGAKVRRRRAEERLLSTS